MVHTLLDGLQNWLTVYREFAYLLGFLVLSLGFYFLFPYSLALHEATSRKTPFSRVDVAKQIRKPHRAALLACSIVIFCFFHFGLLMPGLALIGGGTMLAVLVIVDGVQIHRDIPPAP